MRGSWKPLLVAAVALAMVPAGASAQQPVGLERC
jgi:hypothetical protein